MTTSNGQAGLAANRESDHRALYEVVRARDRRFDGYIFVGVETTGVYCRPVCTVPAPRRENCRFFSSAGAAESAGFRPCLRCRPELAPGVSKMDAVSRLAALALRRIEDGALSEMSVKELAAEFGVTERHFRRAIQREVGASPVNLAQTQRLLHAKQLLADTVMPVTDVAFASGFRSLSRFNALFRQRYHLSPSRVRNASRSARRDMTDGDAYTFELSYRPPYDFTGMLQFLERRATPSVELVRDGSYQRTLRVAGNVGWVSVGEGRRPCTLKATVSASLSSVTAGVIAKLKALFDLRASSTIIDEHLSRDEALRALVAERPGLRVPGTADGFELLIRAIVGQQVTVQGATTLASRLVAAFGEPITTPRPELRRLSPTAARLASADVSEIAAIGLPRRRAETVRECARSYVAGDLVLESGADPDRLRLALRAIDGIGEWTIEYVAMRALAWPDAFPATDLGLRRALGNIGARELREMSMQWRPWRAYAALHLWTSLTDQSRP